MDVEDDLGAYTTQLGPAAQGVLCPLSGGMRSYRGYMAEMVGCLYLM